MKIKNKKEIEEDFDPPRIYSESELKDFHQKIQRFYVPKTLSTGEVITKFLHNDFAVAYGAMVKNKGADSVWQYAIPNRTKVGENEMEGRKRYEQMSNLLKQHEDWKRKNEWVENKKVEELEKMANEIPF